MAITFAAILLGLLFLVRPLQKNAFYMLHVAMVITAAYYVETHIFRAPVFAYKTFLLFVVFQMVSINIVTVLAYFTDKRAAINGNRRVPEICLHTLELMGGWPGAFVAQRLFRHKTKKKEYQTTFKAMIVLEIVLFIYLWHFLNLGKFF